MTTKAAQYPNNDTQRYFDAETQNEELQTIASGQVFKYDGEEKSIRVGIRHAGYIAWLTKLEGGNAWIVAWHEENPDGATAGRATDAPTDTAASRTRDGTVAGLDASITKLPLAPDAVRRADATEEILADMDAKELTSLSGWRGLVLALRDWFASHGFDNLARWMSAALEGTLSDQARADLFAADLVRRARAFVEKGPPVSSGLAGATALSQLRKLADDLPAQEKWLNAEARMRGFKDIEDLAAKDYKVFENLAELWRKRHPAEAMLSRDATPRAPNGKPSNLNEFQWKQVRTPEFKAWFGDWQAVELRARILATKESSATTQGLTEHGAYKDLRAEAKALYHGPAVVENKETHETIRVEASGIENALQHGMSIQKRAVIAVLDEMLGNAAFVVRDTENMKPGVRAVETFAARVALDGKPFVARLVVREVADGRRFYDHELSSLTPESARPTSNSGGSDGASANRQSQPRPLVSLGSRILNQVLNINPDTVSKVVDKNGEPMVVYHGTTRDFSVFEPLWVQLDRILHPSEKKPGGALYDYYTRAKAEPELHFFTETEWVAEGYADQGEGAKVISAFLNVRDPSRGEMSGVDDRDNAIDRMLEEEKDGANFYDTSVSGRYGGDAWVVRASTQIKSATDNTGAFDSSNPDIRLSRSPDAAQRADAILADSTAKWRPLDAITKAGVKLVHFDRATKALYARAGKLLDALTPEKVKAGMVADYGVPGAVLDQRALMQGRKRVQLRKTEQLIQMAARRGEPPMRLRTPPLRAPATEWVLDRWPPVRLFHPWVRLRAGTLRKEAAQREREALLWCQKMRCPLAFMR